MVNQFESVPKNIAYRLLKIVRDEYVALCSNLKKGPVKGGDPHQVYEEHLQQILLSEENQNVDYSQQKGDQLKHAILEGISELRVELDTCSGIIASQALEHIYSNELILTIGKSKSVEAFLKHAAKKNRKFQVVIAEGAPFNHVCIFDKDF